MESAGLEDADGLILEELSNGKPVAYITGLKVGLARAPLTELEILWPRLPGG